MDIPKREDPYRWSDPAILYRSLVGDAESMDYAYADGSVHPFDQSSRHGRFPEMDSFRRDTVNLIRGNDTLVKRIISSCNTVNGEYRKAFQRVMV